MSQTNLGNSSAASNGRRPRIRHRLKSFFKKGQADPSQSLSAQTTSVPINHSSIQRHSPRDANTGDRQRTRRRYLDAMKLLGEAVNAYEGRWGSFDYPELAGEPEDFNDSLFREKINDVIEAHKNEINNPKVWAKRRKVAP